MNELIKKWKRQFEFIPDGHGIAIHCRRCAANPLRYTYAASPETINVDLDKHEHKYGATR